MASSDCSPEFEFWMVGNPSFPQPHLLTADELFVDGVLLPLHHLHSHDKPNSITTTTTITTLSSPPPPPPPPPPPIRSKRWKDIFKDSSDKAELININIWPFSRSRSAGNGSKTAATSNTSRHKVSRSEPCSRSNSQGESSSSSLSSSSSKPKKFASSIHIGRSRPVWQLRRSAKCVEAKVGGEGLTTCIGYRDQLNCRPGDKDEAAGDECSGGGGGETGGGGGNGSIFSFKTIFSKKVY